MVGVGTGSIESSMTYAVVDAPFASAKGGLIGLGLVTDVADSYYDATMNPDATLDNGYGAPQSTAELQSISFYESAGWDISLESDGAYTKWKLTAPAPNYPSLFWQFE